MRREEPVGARLREPGTEGRPGAADPSVGADTPYRPYVRFAVSLVTGVECGHILPEFRWYHGVIPP